MAIRRIATLAILALGALAQQSADAGVNEPIIENVDEIPEGADIKSPPNPLLNQLKVAAQVTFPDSEVFGIKLVNGRPTTAHFNIHNNEDDPVKIRMLGGSLWPLEIADLKDSAPVRNLSTNIYNSEIPAQSNKTLTYKFSTELHPQDLRLLLAGIVEDKNGASYQLEAFNGTVSVVEAPISIFDPQTLFIYAFIGAFFGLTCYFIYNTWIKAYLPQQKRRTGGPSRKPQAAAAATTASTTGSKGYDESWIDPRLLQRPDARRSRSGTPRTRAK